MATKKTTPELVDTIEYENQARKPVVIKLLKYGPNAYTVLTSVDGTTRSRGFASEKQANDHIIAMQRG